MSICGSAYMLTAFFGYAVFKGDVDANLLKNYEVKGTDVSTLMDIVRVGFGLSFTFSYPIILFEARHNLDMLVFGDQPYSFKRYLCWNIGIVSLTLTAGILASGIDVVLGLVGSTCSSCRRCSTSTLTKIRGPRGARYPPPCCFVGVLS